MKRLVLALLFLAAPAHAADVISGGALTAPEGAALFHPVRLDPGTRVERPGLPIIVTGTGENAAWLFYRPDVEAVVLQADDLARCEGSIAQCEKVAASMTARKGTLRAALPWVIAGGIVAAFAGGVYVGAHAK